MITEPQWDGLTQPTLTPSLVKKKKKTTNTDELHRSALNYRTNHADRIRLVNNPCFTLRQARTYRADHTAWGGGCRQELGRTLSAGVERREPRRDGEGAAIVVPVRGRAVVFVLPVLPVVVAVLAVGEQAGAAAVVAVEGAGEAEEVVEGLAVHVVGGCGGEGGADECRDGQVERVGRGGLHGGEVGGRMVM